MAMNTAGCSGLEKMAVQYTEALRARGKAMEAVMDANVALSNAEYALEKVSRALGLEAHDHVERERAKACGWVSW